MNTTNGSEWFDIRLSNQGLMRDAQNAQRQFDRIGQTAVGVGRQIDTSFSKTTSGISSSIQGMAANFKSAIGDMAKSMVGFTALMAGGSFLKDLYSDTKAFNREMRVVSTISQEVTQDMEGYKQKIEEICSRIAIAPAEAAKALYQINSAGHLGAEGLKVLESSAKNAIGGVTEVYTSADTITTILNAYKLSANEAEAISDKLFTTVRLGKTTMSEIGHSISQVAPVAATFGVSIDEVLALVAELTKQGTPTAAAMVQISQGIMQCTKVLGDGAFETRNLLQAFEEVEARSKGSENQLRADLGNVRALRAVLASTGKSAEETRQFIDEIKNSSGSAQEAFEKMNSLGSNQMQILKNNFQQAFREMFESMSGTTNSIAKSLNEAFDTGAMEKAITTLTSVIALYGVYKGVILATSAVQTTVGRLAHEAEIEGLAKVIAMKGKEADADIAAAVAAGKLSAATGEKIIAMRAEAESVVALLRAKEQEAIVNLQNLATVEVAAKKRYYMAVDNLKVAQMQLVAAKESGDAFAISAAEVEVENAALERNNALKSYNAATSAKQVASEAAEAASTQASAAAKALDSTANIADTTTTNALTGAKIRLTAATTALKKTLLAHPYALAAAAILGLAIAVYKYTHRVTEADKATQKLNEVTRQMGTEVSSEKAEITSLLTTLKDAKKDTKEYKDAKKKIVDQYGQYLQGIINEKGEINDLAEAYRILTQEINNAARARALDTLNKADEDKWAADNKKTIDDLVKLFKDAGYSEKDAVSAADRMVKSIQTTGQAPQDLRDKFDNFTAAQMLARARQMSGSSNTGYTPEKYAKLQQLLAGKQNLTPSEADRIWIESGLGKTSTGGTVKYSSASTSRNMDFARYTRALQGNQTTFDNAKQRNKAALGMVDNDRSRFADFSDDVLSQWIAYVNSDSYGGKGLNFTLGGETKFVANTEEEVRSLVAFMQQELNDRATETTLKGAASGNGTQDKGGYSAAEIQKLIDDANNAKTEEDLKAAYEALESAKSGIDINDPNYQRMQTAWLNTKKKYQGLTSTSSGNHSGKTKDQLQAEVVAANQEIIDEETSQQRERVEAMSDWELQLWQARIDAGEYGSEKMAQQRELDRQKELSDLRKQMDAEIVQEVERQKALFDKREEWKEKEAEAQGKKYAKKTFDPGQVLSTMSDYTFGDTFEGNGGNVSTVAIDEIRAKYEVLRKYLQTSTLRTLEESDAAAMNQYLRQYGTYMQKRQAIIDQANLDLAKANSEGEQLSITAKMKKDLAELDIEANKKTSAISKMFADLSQKSVAELRKLADEGQAALDFLIEGKWDADKGIQFGMTEEVFNMLKASPEELEKIRKAIRDIRREADAAEGAFGKMSNGLKKVFKAGSDQKKLTEGLSEIQNGFSQIQQAADFLGDTLNNLQDVFGQGGALGAIGDGLSAGMDAMNSAMSGAQAGAMFGPWGAAAGAAIGLVGSLASSLSKLHDAKHEKKIQQIQEQIEVLEKAYAKLGKAIEKSYSKDASNLIDQQNKMLEQQKVLIQNQIAEEKAKKKTDNDRIKQWQDQLDEINDTIESNKEKAIDAIFGQDIKSAIDSMADAYASMLDKGNSRITASKDLVKNMIKSMIVEAMKADISAPMERIRQKMLDFWADSYIDANERSILDGMVDQLMGELQDQYGWADSYFSDTFSQDSSKGGFQAMSQDVGEELNGRFTAVQMNSESIKASMIDVTASLNAMRSVVSANKATLEEIRNVSLIAIDYLESIERNTRELYATNNHLEKIEKNTRYQ